MKAIFYNMSTCATWQSDKLLGWKLPEMA